MINDINLLDVNRPHHSPVVERRVKIFRTVSATFLFLVGVISACLFIISSFSSLPRLKEEEQKLLNDFSSSSLRRETDSYFLTKIRSEDITNLLQKRSRLMEVYNYLLSLTSSSVVLSNLRVDRNTVSFSILSSSLPEVENVMNQVKKLSENDKNIESIKLSSIEYKAETNSYSVLIELVNKVKVEDKS